MPGFIYIITHSTEAPGRSATSIEHAHATQAAGHQVDLWLADEGVRLAAKAVVETYREPVDAAAMLTALVANGAKLFADRGSFERREFTEDALREGAELAEASVLAELIIRGRTPVTV